MTTIKVLVTGSSGLIGTSVCKKMMDRGFEPITMDIRSSPEPDLQPKFTDITNLSEVKRAVKDIQSIIHLAAVSRVIDGENNPDLCRKTNIQGTSNILKAITDSQHNPWLIYGSSREVYGEPEEIPVPEDHSIHPINIYGETKAYAEKNIHLWAQCRSFNSIIFRYSNVYGSIHDHKTRVIPAFMRAALKEQPLRVDCPDHVFDFTYVEDVAEATVRGAEALSNNHLEGILEFNVSPGVGTSLTELVDIISKVTGKEVSTVPGKRRDYDVCRYIGDVSFLEKTLRYRCLTSLKEGLRLLHDDYLQAMEVQHLEDT